MSFGTEATDRDRRVVATKGAGQMAFAALRFPEDIRWARLCVTEPMMDREVCDQAGPRRWRSSAAVFTYEPPEEEQPYPDQTICYLKVVATITGFQPDGREIKVDDADWETVPGIEDFEEVLDEYYPCYGALIEVVVGPGPRRPTEEQPVGEEAEAVGEEVEAPSEEVEEPTEDVEESVEDVEEPEIGSTEEEAAVEEEKVPLSDYPYIVAVEPQKRELYELVSETGERSSRSLQGVNVKAGSTTVDSTEVLDVNQGFSVSVPVAEGTPPVGVSSQGQWGTRGLASTERYDIRTTDSLEEMRNTLSRTTNLTQMYSLFQAYHVGTNRVLFFLQPRPHTVQSNFTFVNGPRQLEGIQEVFLVVVRPKDQEHPVVKVDLETAHLSFQPDLETETRTETHELHILAKAQDRGGSWGDDSAHEEVSDSSTYVPPAGWEIEGYEYASVSGQQIVDYNVEWGPTFLTIFGIVEWTFDDRFGGGNELVDGRLDIEVRVRIKSRTPTQTGEVETLFLTGRRLCCGDTAPSGVRPQLPDWIVGELDLNHGHLRFARGPATPDALLESRRIVAVLSGEIRKLAASRRRYPLGQVHFFDTDLFQRRLAAHLRSHGVGEKVKLEGAPKQIVDRYKRKGKGPFTISDYLAVPAAQLARASGEPEPTTRRQRLLTALRFVTRPAE